MQMPYVHFSFPAFLIFKLSHLVFSFYHVETEENNRMRKTRDLFKKIRDTKGTFHAKMGIIKYRNGVDPT